MIPLDTYLPMVQQAVEKFGRYPPNLSQVACIEHPANHPLMIVAGPGSGKTTVLVLRALRLVLVDGLLPENIVITTFTRKAADEIRSRLIEWGRLLVEYLREQPLEPRPQDFETWLASIDVNRFVTGTLDSLCEEVLRRYRDGVTAAPAVLERFVANADLSWKGIFPAGAHRSEEVGKYLGPFTFNGEPPRNYGERLKVFRTLLDRLTHDSVSLESYCRAKPHAKARDLITKAAEKYWASLLETNRLDFARLEQIFLDRTREGRLERFVSGVRAVLVDEYQDTNPLQESIYFELVQQTEASFTVVGDDDQSLYRFRGATIELFRDFVGRFRQVVPGMRTPQLRHLVENYRSTPEIVTFFNDYIETDASFAPARVQPPKPRIQAQLPSRGVLVLGMFRDSREQLAEDLSDTLMQMFRGPGYTFQGNGAPVKLRRAAAGGDFGDCVVLGHTVNEYRPGYGGKAPEPRFPRLLREHLASHGVGVFNPRGRALRDIPEVQRLLGLLLECIDPAVPALGIGARQAALLDRRALRREADNYLLRWRATAREFIATNPDPISPHALGDFVGAWQVRRPQAKMAWPEEWPLLELCFKFLAWFPEFRDDPEGQVYLEAISRAIAQAASFSPFRSTLVFGEYEARSVERAITDILAPIAENTVEVDEEIMPSVPRDRLCLMTIHQAKGLEYPLVIVDVGSDYKRDHWKQRFRRFPEKPSNVVIMEDDLAPHCDIGPLRQAREPLARTFDDLVRLYYVAYSRAQTALMLVGLTPVLRADTRIKHVATGWRSDGTWAWAPNLPLYRL